VGAADPDYPTRGNQLRQGFLPGHDRHTKLPGTDQFGVLGRHRRGDNYRADTFDVCGIMALEDRGAELSDVGSAGWIGVAPADCYPAAAGDERQSTHASATDAHEMDGTGIGGIEQIHVGELI
jgi:hypothetical protein